LPSISHSTSLGTSFAAVDGYLVWHDLYYDPRTGRTVPTPAALRTRPNHDPVDGNPTDLPDGLVSGDGVTISGALFDPRNATWTEIPAPPDRDSPPAEPKAPHENVIRMGYAWVGGPDDIVRFHQGDIVTTGSDTEPVTITAQPGQVDVLRQTS
jgi:hypothetical protein